MIDAEAIRRVFEEIHRTTFVLDPASNPRLGIDVIDAGLAYDTPTFVLVTPWTLNGLAFPPDHRFPGTLEISAKPHRAYPIEVPALGRHLSINLVPDVSNLPSFAYGRKVAETIAPVFRVAVAKARESITVTNPSRRRLLRGQVRPASPDLITNAARAAAVTLPSHQSAAFRDPRRKQATGPSGPSSLKTIGGIEPPQPEAADLQPRRRQS